MGCWTTRGTDELGFYAVENKLRIHDVHATILHLSGLDHTKFTYQYGGRTFRPTDVGEDVLHALTL